jgi:hypothetical protein
MKTCAGDELVNIGADEDIAIAEFARVVAATVGYAGGISLAAPRENCSTSASWPGSAGGPAPDWRTASGSPMRPTLSETSGR